MAHTFAALAVANLDEIDAASIQQWAEQVNFAIENPPHSGSWSWKYSQLRQALNLALFSVGMRYEKLGQSLGRGFVHRLGAHGVMPDIVFFRGEPRNRLYGYYLDGAADIVVEFIQPGCETYLEAVKKPIYAAAGVPELWIVDVVNRRIELLRLVEGIYEAQMPDATGRYAVSSVPGLTFFPNKIWLAQDDWDYPLEENWFEVAIDAPRITKIPKIGEGVDWSKALMKFPVALDPVTISFEDYIYWCPEAKFEFVDGRPDIGGREGIKGLAGMLLMTFGLTEVVKLAHPRDWVKSLLERRARAKDPDHKAEAWKQARAIAAFLRDHYAFDRIVVSGDLVSADPLNAWSELVFFVWGLAPSESDYLELRPGSYTHPQAIVPQLSASLPARLVDASKSLTEAEQQMLQGGSIEL